MPNTYPPRIEKTCKTCGKLFYVKQSQVHKRVFCSHYCKNHQPVTIQKQRLWKKLLKTDSCWLWTGYLCRGYGAFKVNGRYVYTHRVAWELLRGPIPEGLDVLHNCPGGDNKACCNPAHLWLGTQRENNQDAVRKGQIRRGERHGMAKLKEDDVRLIRRLFSMSNQKIADLFGVSYGCIKEIRNGNNWSHLT